MTLTQFKEFFKDYSAGIPVEGPNSAQWKKLVEAVSSLEEAKPVVSAKTK